MTVLYYSVLWELNENSFEKNKPLIPCKKDAVEARIAALSVWHCRHMECSEGCLNFKAAFQLLATQKNVLLDAGCCPEGRT